MRLMISIERDGAEFRALLGESVEEGIAGFGFTPADAVRELFAQPELEALLRAELNEPPRSRGKRSDHSQGASHEQPHEHGSD
jgi:hypothetical protein